MKQLKPLRFHLCSLCLSQVSDGLYSGHAIEPKAGSQAEPQRYSPSLDESLYQVMVWALVKALLTTSAGWASLRPKCSVQEGKVAGNQRGGGSWSPPLPCRKPVSAGKSVFCFQCVVVTSDKIAGKGKRKRKWLMLQNWVIYPFLSRSFIYFTCGKNQPWVLQFSFLFLPHSLWIHQLERLAVSQEPDLSTKSLPDVQSHKHVNHWQEPNDKLLPVR